MPPAVLNKIEVLFKKNLLHVETVNIPVSTMCRNLGTGDSR